MAPFLRRASSCLISLATSVKPLAKSSSPAIRLRNHPFAFRPRPFCTNTPSPESSDKSPPLAFGTSDMFSSLDGLPFDSVEKDPEDGSLTFRRKTKDEIIELKVEAPVLEVNDEGVPPLLLYVKIHYGDDFGKCFEAECKAFPNNLFAMYRISFRHEGKSGGRKHLDDFEDFFKRRGVEPRNLNFLVDYLSKRNETKKTF